MKAINKVRQELKMIPSSSGTVIGKVDKGEVVDIIKKADGLWTQVVCGDKYGYVKSFYLEPCNEGDG